MITQPFTQTPLITRTRRVIARLAHSRPVSSFINFPPVARTVQRLTYANTVPQHARQQPRVVQPARHAGASLQSRLDEIARDIVEALGYTGVLITTYEQGDSLPVRALYTDPSVASPEEIARWEAHVSRFSSPDYPLSLSNPKVARVFMFHKDFQQNLSVRAAQAGEPIVSDRLYDLFLPVAPPSSEPMIASIQRALGVRQIVAVPFFLESTTDGRSTQELVGNLLVLKNDMIEDKDIRMLSAFGRQTAAAILSERRRLQIEVAQALTYQMHTHLQDETQILNRIAKGVVTDLGYVGCMVATYERNESLPMRAMYVDPTVATMEQIRAVEAEIERLSSPGQRISLTDPEVARVFVNRPEYAENLSVIAAKAGRPIVSNSLYDLFTPIAPLVSKPFLAGIQLALGMQHVIAVPLFLEILVDGHMTRKLIGNLFAATRSQQFSSGEIELLQAFGQQAAVAIHNARLYQQSEDRRLAAQIFGKMAFSATASVHALRNHIGVVRGNLQLLSILDQFPANERDDLFKDMSRPVFAHLEHIVDTLDTLHEPWQRPQDGQVQINTSVYRGIKKAGGEGIAQLTLELDEELPEIRASADMLAEAFAVLIKQALRATRQRPLERRIVIRSERLSNGIGVTVSDNGGGLSPELVDKLFEIRYRTELGSGFELYWTKEYIEGIGGHIDVLNAPGEGLTVRVYIPFDRKV